MYKVHLMTTGNVTTVAKHELIKGLPDHDFQNLFDCFQSPSSNTLSTINVNDLYQDIQSPAPTATTGLQSPAPTAITGLQSPAPTAITGLQCPAPTTHSTGNKRFAELPLNPREFILTKENSSTKSKTSSHIKLLKEFLSFKNEFREPQNIESRQLNEYLMEFILCVRQKDGSEYEPVSLRSMISSIDRHLKQHEYETTIARGESFSTTMMAFASKGKDLKQKGMGNKPKSAAPVSDAEIRQLYESDQLGNINPTSLINTLWLNNTLHFGMRGGGAEHRQLMWGDVQLCMDTELACEYLEYNERQTKTRTGTDITNIRDQKPRMYATGFDTCPVRTYKLYADHRPDNYSGPQHPFYLAVVTHKTHPKIGEQWFLRSPIGKNKLNTLMKTMATRANLPELHQGKRLTNTSIRKRLCQKPIQANVPDTYAVHVTGHKNADSLNNYRTLTPFQQKTMSNILASSSSTTHNQIQSSSHNVAPSGSSCHAALANMAFDDLYQPAITSSAVELASDQDTEIAVVRGSTVRKSTVLTHAHKRTISSDSQSGIVPYLFQNATITGGTINITINTGKKSRRETDSQEDVVQISQD